MNIKEKARTIKNKPLTLKNKRYILIKKKPSKKIKRITIKTYLKKGIIELLKLSVIFALVSIMQAVINGNQLEFYETALKVFNIDEALQAFQELGEFLCFNITISIAIYLIFYAVTSRKKISLIAMTSILFIYEIANYVVTTLRGSSLTVLDILSVRTALNVSKNLSIKFSAGCIVGIVIFIITIILICVFYKKSKKQKAGFRLLSAATGIIALVLIFNSQEVSSIPIWDVDEAYRVYGTNLTFVRMLKDLKVQAPENYNKTEVENLLEQYVADSTETAEDVNIVIIMNESFADYKDCEAMGLTQDVIPFFHSLQKEDNVITGIMYSDYFGTKTANIEYELLTQNTAAFLPEGAIVYQQYITSNVDSLVSKLNNLNYTTHAIHTWFSSGYNRPRVYNLLGFNDYKFKEAYDDLEYDLSGYTTDASAYSKIIEQFEEKAEGEKIFSFNVTMQNHMPYSTLDENAEIYSDYNTDVNSYMQRLRKSDEALETLIEYFRNYDEKVILLFFGDHQPNLWVWEVITDDDYKYQVPYLIWANYDIDENQYGDTSAVFLQSILLQTANLPKDEYTNYMIELRQEIPVITANYYIASDNQRYNLDDETSPYYEKLQEYKNIVYYQMFDKN